MLIPDDREMRDREPQGGGDRLIVFLFALLIFGGFAAEILVDVSPARMAILFFLIFWIPLTLLHEAGHAFAARWVGWRVENITVGFGRIVSQRRIFGMPVEFRLFPLVGMVEIIPSSLESPRLKNAFIYAAGPGVELIVVGLIVGMLGWDAVTSAPETYGVAALQATCLAALVGVFINLLPISAHPGVVTDGMGIIQSPFLPRVYFEGMMVRPVLAQARQHLENGQYEEAFGLLEDAEKTYPDVLILQAAIGRALVDMGHKEEALLRLRAFVLRVEEKDRREAELIMDRLRAYIQQRKNETL